MQADIDNSGTIDYGEFIAATLHMNKLERDENLVSAFSFFDKDGSGYITVDELSQACKDFGLDDVQLDEMIKEIDQNNVSSLLLNNFLNLIFLISPVSSFQVSFFPRILETLSNLLSIDIILVSFFQDGQIDYNEFAAMMRKGNGEVGRRTMRNSLRVNLADAFKIAEH